MSEWRLEYIPYTRQNHNYTPSVEIHLGHLLAVSSVMALDEVGLDLTETRVSIQYPGSLFKLLFV